MMKPTLIFVYNADSGLFNLMADVAHKIFAPATYPCNLCALTHTNWGMRQEWKEFIANLAGEVKFLHANQLRDEYGLDNVTLPAVFSETGGALEVWLDSAAINACQTLGELKELITGKLGDGG